MVDLMSKKFYFFGLSIIIIIIGIIGFVVNGLQLDIQFKGGTIFEIQMNDNKFDEKKAEVIVKNSINKIATAQKSQTYNAKDTTNNINILQINVASSLTADERNKIVEALRKDFNIKADAQMSTTYVDPLIGKETLLGGLKAVIGASICIILYVWWRFSIMSGLSAGVFAVLALFHDILIMLAVYTVFKIPVNEAFIAAVLTIIGYSMNDTIIIYDRIRENSGLLRKVPIAELVNKSIIQTLARSINTVVTVLISIITVYVFARIYNIGTMADFSLPLIVGIASGCYSSIFIASPLWVMWKESQAKKKVTAKPAKA